MASIIFILLCSLLFIFLLFFVFSAFKVFNNKQLESEKKVTELKHKYEFDILKSKIQTQEQTFQKVSREIHDNIGQKLSLAKILINGQFLHNSTLDKTTFSEIASIITESLEDLRDISRSLNSDLIATNGLVSALQHHIGQLNSLGQHNFKLTVTGESDLIDPQAELAVFRIVQEALNNVVKHASATQVHVEVYYGSDHLGIAITDNGCGFDPSTTASGNGLTNMKSRVQALQGDFTITSTPDTGTRIQIKIPKHV